MTISTSYLNGIDTCAGPSPPTPAAPDCEHVRRAEALLDDVPVVAANTASPGSQNGSALTGARAELQVICRQIEHAAEDVAAAQRPIAYLQRSIADADLSARDLETAQSAERDVLGAWLASDMQGPRPQPGKPLLEAERRSVEAAQNASAARSRLPDAQAVVQRASAHRNALVQRRSEAHKAAILEAVDEYLETKFLPALRIFRSS